MFGARFDASYYGMKKVACVSPGSHRKTGPAPAGRRRYRIFNPERGPNEVVDKIDLSAGHVLHGNRVDQHGGAVVRKHEVVVRLGGDAIELVLESGASAARDADAQHRAWRLGLEKLANSPRRAIRHFHRTCHRLSLPV